MTWLTSPRGSPLPISSLQAWAVAHPLFHKSPCTHGLGCLHYPQATLSTRGEPATASLGCGMSVLLWSPRARGGPEWSSAQPESAPAAAGLRSLRFLVLHSNLLTSVPAGLAHLPLLTRLDLRDNQLRHLPAELLDAPFVRLQGNPLGEASPDSLSPPGRLGVVLSRAHRGHRHHCCPDDSPVLCTGTPQVLEMPKLFLTSDFDRYGVGKEG